MVSPTDFLSTVLILGAITADYSTVANTICVSASVLATKVRRWQREDGIGGAIDIESDLTELAAALRSLSETTLGCSTVDIDSDITMEVVTNIVTLLNALSAKAQDFRAVGATNVVAHALELLQAPSKTIVGELMEAIAGSPQGKALKPYLNTLESAVNTVNPAYGIPPVHFPTLLA